jgi:hypothetical protein
MLIRRNVHIPSSIPETLAVSSAFKITEAGPDENPELASFRVRCHTTIEFDSVVQSSAGFPLLSCNSVSWMV